MMSNITVKNTENTSLMLEPTNTAEAFALAERLADSKLIPVSFQGKPNDVFVAMMWSRNLGLPIVQGLQSIAVINGRPSIWGDAALAVVKSSGLLESFKETITGEGLKLTATCTVVRRGESEPYVESFSMFDAQTAGLTGKSGPWKQYPKRMLRLRARNFCLRNAFPDVLMGIGMAEEQMDIAAANDSAAPAAAEAKSAAKRPQRKSKTALAQALAAQDLAPVEDAKEVPAADELPEPQVQAAPAAESAEVEAAVQQTEALFGEDVAEEPVDVDELHKKALDDLDRCASYEDMVALYKSLDIRVKPLVKQAFAQRRSALGV